MQTWPTAWAGGDLAISAWVATEFSAPLSIKFRTGTIDSQHRSVAPSAFTRLTATSLVMLPIDERTSRTAARFADQTHPGFRAGDALHRAIAANAGLTVATLDTRPAEAGAAVGVPVERL